jgi:hypothetical protein
LLRGSRFVGMVIVSLFIVLCLLPGCCWFARLLLAFYRPFACW